MTKRRYLAVALLASAASILSLPSTKVFANGHGEELIANGHPGGFAPAPVHTAPPVFSPPPVHTAPPVFSPPPVHTAPPPVHTDPGFRPGFPAHNPGHNPGFPTNPDHNPGHNPGFPTNPGHNPGHNPGVPTNPGHNPGHNPGVPTNPSHNPGHTGNTTPQLPGHVGNGPITSHPGGPRSGLDTAGHGPEFHRGGRPHQPFVVVKRTPLYREPVIAVYSGHWRPLPRFEYLSGFYFGGVFYVGPDPFFWGYNDWAPTEWMYYADTGEWWAPGIGWSVSPPLGYNDVISVAVNEQVAVLDEFGDQVYDVDGDPEFETITVYYNAYWDQIYGAYGYLNRRGNYIWVRW